MICSADLSLVRRANELASDSKMGFAFSFGDFSEEEHGTDQRHIDAVNNAVEAAADEEWCYSDPAEFNACSNANDWITEAIKKRDLYVTELIQRKMTNK